MELELKHLAPYLPYGLKVQYKGILNGKELSDYDKRYNEAINEDFFAEFNEVKPDEVLGLKIGRICSVEPCAKFVKYRIGNKGKQTHYGADNFKPILRPLSDLTKEVEHNGQKFVPVDKLNENSNFTPKDFSYDNSRFNDYIMLNCNDTVRFNLLCTPFEAIQSLFEWHFDVFGLIEKGLAIDINTLTIKN